MPDLFGSALGKVDAASFRWNDDVLQGILSGPDGAVARDLARRAIRVESQAKLNASGRPGPNVDTGRLRSSISWRMGRQGAFLVAQIGSNVSYARYLELGSDRAPAYPFLRPALPAAGGVTVAV